MQKNNQTKNIMSIFSAHENQINAVIVLVLLAVFAIWYFYFIPVKNTLADRYIQIENLKRDVLSLEEKRVRLGNLEKNIQDRAVFVSQVLDVLPDSQQIPEVLFTLEQLASKNNLAITDFVPKNKEEERIIVPGGTSRPTVSPWKTVQLDFNVTGNYKDLKQFMQDIESNIRPIDVQSIAINGGGEITVEKVPQPLRFAVTAHTYYQEVAQ